ncbi:MAG: hypothetical protein JXQ73_29960 [Phycisphaerae bacterium]|nr:hypothetical protein [Phycisphaerae bacterium]
MRISDLVDDVGRRLMRARNDLALAEYEEDTGRDDLGERRQELLAEIRGILLDPTLCDQVERFLEAGTDHAGSLLTRKALLLHQEMRFAQIECNSELENCRQDLKRCLTKAGVGPMTGSFDSPDPAVRRRSLASLAEAVRGIEQPARVYLRLSNQVAQSAGYPSFADAKLACEETSIEELSSLFRRWRDECLPVWHATRKLMEAQLSAPIEAQDLVWVLTRLRDRMVPLPQAKASRTLLTQLIEPLGISLDTLPMSLSFREFPCAGACYRVDPPTDIRVVVNKNLQGFAAMFYMLHEFGHAYYYAHCPTDSDLLIDRGIVRETMADLWPLLLLNPDVVLRQAPRQQRLAARSPCQAWRSLRLLLYLRDSVFTLELLRSPEQAFSEVWRAVTNECLGIDDASGAFETFDLPNLLDMKNYVLSQRLSDEISRGLIPALSDGPESVEEEIRGMCREANVAPWQKRLLQG